MGTEDVTFQPQQQKEEQDNFKNYEREEKVCKNSFKKKLSQAKRLLVNKASKEYSQVEEQSQPKSISKMLISVSKINELKAMVNSKTKTYDKAEARNLNSNE